MALDIIEAVSGMGITQLTSAIMTIQSFASTRFISFIRVYILIATKQVPQDRLTMNLLYIRDAIFRRDNDGILLSSGGQEGLKGWLLLKEKIAWG
jgi:hypothetical protein